MPYVVSKDGARIYYEVVGHGEPLVLIEFELRFDSLGVYSGSWVSRLG